MNKYINDEDNIRVFKYPSYLRIIFFILTPVTLAILITLALATPRPYSLFDIIAGIILLSVPLVTLYGFLSTSAKLILKSDTIEYHPLMGRTKKIALDEIGGLEARHRLERLDIYDKSGNKVMHIYYALSGFNEILDSMSGK